ncbi:MAG: DUF2934 domain-containing protein [Bryobacterales bacterium]|nr:DUF2934 domain-containing protein [Bryobacterales bacterium]
MPVSGRKKAGGPTRPAATRTKKAQPAAAVSSEEIARLAYSYWEARGRTGGSAAEDWFRAELELKARLKPPPRKRARAKPAGEE